jgi:hypothetical protein
VLRAVTTAEPSLRLENSEAQTRKFDNPLCVHGIVDGNDYIH